MPDLDRSKSLHGEIRAGRPQRGNHLRIVGKRQLGVQAADDVHLGRAFVVGFLRLPRHLVDVVGELAFLFVRAAGEGAELAAQDADVGVVEIKIEDVGRDVPILAFAGVVGEVAERVDVLDVVEAQTFLVGQPLRGEDLFGDVGQALRAMILSMKLIVNCLPRSQTPFGNAIAEATLLPILYWSGPFRYSDKNLLKQ